MTIAKILTLNANAINGCNLLTIFQRAFKKTVEVVHTQKLAVQPRFNAVLVIEMINNFFFSESNKEIDYLTKQKRLL